MADTVEKSRRTPMWLRLLLIGSLALNLLVVGVIAGALLSPDGPRAQRAQLAERVTAMPFLRALESDDRRELFRGLRNQPAVQRAAEPMRVSPEVILTVVRAEPFDAEALAQIMEQQRRAGLDRQARGERALIVKLSEMSPSERAKYADRLEEAFERRGPKKR